MEEWTDFLADHMGKLLIAFFVMMVVFLYQSCKEDAQLMQECLNDGHKAYECRSMLRPIRR